MRRHDALSRVSPGPSPNPLLLNILIEREEWFNALPLQLWIFDGDSVHQHSVFAFMNAKDRVHPLVPAHGIMTKSGGEASCA